MRRLYSKDYPLHSYARVRDLVCSLAGLISKDYNPQAFLCILDASFMFAADLIRVMHNIRETTTGVYFIKISSYDGVDRHAPICKGVFVPPGSLEGLDILILDTVEETGDTLRFVTKVCLEEFKVHEVRSAVLVSKRADPTADYVGTLADPNKFLYGYGLDMKKGFGRNIPHFLVEEQSNTKEKQL